MAMQTVLHFTCDQTRLQWGAEVWNLYQFSISRTNVVRLQKAVEALWPGVYYRTGKEDDKNGLVLQMTGKVVNNHLGVRGVSTKVELWRNGHIAVTNPAGSWDGALPLP